VGDTPKDLLLTEARAVVIREYLTQNFGFDDAQLKTLGKGKQLGANRDADEGSIQVLVFPTGTEIPVDQPVPTASASTPGDEHGIKTTDAASHTPEP
jgi:hypothetical protein